MTLSESVMNDQRVFQEISNKPPAIQRMEAVQDRFDAGESIRDVYWKGELGD